MLLAETVARRGDLAAVVSTWRGQERVRLYLVSSVSADGQVKGVRIQASSPLVRLADLKPRQVLIGDQRLLQINMILLVAPFEGFASLEETEQFLSEYRSQA